MNGCTTTEYGSTTQNGQQLNIKWFFFSKRHMQPRTETATFRMLCSDIVEARPRNAKHGYKDSNAINSALLQCNFTQVPLSAEEIKDSEAFKLILEERIDRLHKAWILTNKGDDETQTNRTARKRERRDTSDRGYAAYRALPKEERERNKRPTLIRPSFLQTICISEVELLLHEMICEKKIYEVKPSIVLSQQWGRI